MKTNIIYNEDCLEGMKKLPDNSIDLIVTSPPYNTGSRNDCMINAKYTDFNDNKTEKEYLDWTIERFKILEKKVKDKGVICYNMSYSVAFPNLHYKTIVEIMKQTKFKVFDTIIWEKNNALPLSTSPKQLTRICELVFIFSKNDNFNCYKDFTINPKTKQKFYKCYPNKIKTKNNDGSTPNHKATFSTDFVEHFIDLYSKKGDIVVDPFIGTGTTGVASLNLDRKYIGYEIDKEYYKIAVDRVSKVKKQTKLKEWFK